MMDVPENANEACPGTASKNAGKVSACSGCPNQKICATAVPSPPDPAIADIAKKMQSIKHKLLILSGKGGVGKSTLTAQLAYCFAQDANQQIGVLDVDICGPSMPRILGLQDEQVHQSGSGWSPVFAEDNLAVMSVGFLLESDQDAVIWRGPKKNGLIKQFLRDVDWSGLDILLIDTPPGTSDEHLSLVQFLSCSQLTGAVVITTPQEVSLQDVRKEINFCRKVNLPILGIVENMSGFVCPKCKGESDIFPADSGGAETMCKALDCRLLGKVPLDPSLGQSCDEGTSYVERFPKSPAALSLLNVANELRNIMGEEKMEIDTF